MDCQSRLVQIALEFEAGGLDELLIVRIMGNCRQLADNISPANPFQIDVGKSIRAWKQACWFRRSMLAQKDGEGDRSRHQQNAKENGKASSYAHGEMARMIAEGESARVGADALVPPEACSPGVPPAMTRCVLPRFPNSSSSLLVILNKLC